MVHLPIALAMLGIPIVLAALLFRETAALRWAAVLCYALVFLSSFGAVFSGERARDNVPPTLGAEAANLLSQHAKLGDQVAWIALFPLAFALLSFAPRDGLRLVALLFAAAGALTLGAFVGMTAHLGGELVYKHGVGTPHMQAAPPAAAPVAETPSAVSGDAPSEDGGPAPEAAVDTLPEDSPEVIAIRPIDMAEAEALSFAADVEPILEQHCLWCHRGRRPDSGLDMTSRENMIKGGRKLGASLIPGKPDESPLILYTRGIYQPQMPEGEPPVSEDELHVMRLWIAAGAPDDN